MVSSKPLLTASFKSFCLAASTVSVLKRDTVSCTDMVPRAEDLMSSDKRVKVSNIIMKRVTAMIIWRG